MGIGAEETVSAKLEDKHCQQYISSHHPDKMDGQDRIGIEWRLCSSTLWVDLYWKWMYTRQRQTWTQIFKSFAVILLKGRSHYRPICKIRLQVHRIVSKSTIFNPLYSILSTDVIDPEKYVIIILSDIYTLKIWYLLDGIALAFLQEEHNIGRSRSFPSTALLIMLKVFVLSALLHL